MYWQDGQLVMLNQQVLPNLEEWLTLTDAAQVAEAIRSMAVRGAPAIGVAAAYGMALAAGRGDDLSEAAQVLSESRPTAINLFWAIDRMIALGDVSSERYLEEAKAIEAEDLAMNLQIGEMGAALIKQGWNVMTICNTGGLATAGHGTALGVLRSAHNQGKAIHVWSCETRPRQQGLRLTAYELLQEGIPFHSIADSAAAMLMQQGKVDCVIAGADRILKDGQSANKVGTYSLAVLAHYHQIPFYIAAPSSTLDLNMPSGGDIPIEERDGIEITEIEGVRIAPQGTPTYNPGFDITPGELITAIVTETGIHWPPYQFGK
jgi:methylthioribose-1-phosphate isomerase